MARKKKPGSNLLAISGAAPLALALLVGNAVLPSPGKQQIIENPKSAAAVKCGDDLTDFRDCHTEYPTGCTAAGRYEAYLNLLKNAAAPARTADRYLTEQDFAALEARTPKGLRKGNHEQFKNELANLGEGRTVGVVAYLYYAQPTGRESTNCQLDGAEDVDYHIGIGFDPKLAALAASKKRVSAADHKRLMQNAVIVEMTPHYRAFFQPNWNLDDLKHVLGKQVRVEGQLMIDNEHYVPSQDCGIEGSDAVQCWRSTAWELHPVTKFQVCNGTSCQLESANWVELEDAQPGAAVVAASDTGGHARTRSGDSQ